MNEIFSNQFLAAISGLSIKVRSAPPRTAVGAHLSPRPGGSLEFRDFQAYTPGDDLRRVDWATYGRTRHLFVRRFEHPTTVPVSVLVDSSASMHQGSITRYVTAARMAVAIVSAAISAQNPVRVMLSTDGAVPQLVSGRAGLVRLLGDLSSRPVAGRIGIAASISTSLPLLANRGRGIFAIVSDLFEPRGVESLIEALRLVPGRLILVQVTRANDAEPDLAGDYELDDCETHHRMNLHVDQRSVLLYRKNYQSYFSALNLYASSRGARLARVDVDVDPTAQLEALFPFSVLSL